MSFEMVQELFFINTESLYPWFLYSYIKSDIIQNKVIKSDKTLDFYEDSDELYGYNEYRSHVL